MAREHNKAATFYNIGAGVSFLLTPATVLVLAVLLSLVGLIIWLVIVAT